MLRITKDQTNSLKDVCNKIKESMWRTDLFVQRNVDQWKTSEKNELIHTVLKDQKDGFNYIPPILIGESNNNYFILDGLQRCYTFSNFKMGNYKITRLDNPIVHYDRKVVDENGDYIKEGGEFKYETVEYNLTNKTYNDLPQELKDRFDDYQLNSTVFMNCSMSEMGELVVVLNNHTAMNANQKSFTHLSNFAYLVRQIIEENSFFLDCGSISANDKKKNALDGIIMDTVMYSFHKDDWNKDMTKRAKYLNVNATTDEFDTVNNIFERLIPFTDTVECPEVAGLFKTKNTYLWASLFYDFTSLGLDDSKFGDFLNAFVTGYSDTEIDGLTWDDVESNRSTKDKKVINAKYDYLHSLMMKFLNIESENLVEETENKEIEVDSTEDTTDEDCFEFIKTNINPDVTDEDINCYKEVLDDLLLNVDNNTPLLDKANYKSLLGIVAWSFVNDTDLDEWIIDYFDKNKTYDACQAVNFAKMKASVISYKAA